MEGRGGRTEGVGRCHSVRNSFFFKEDCQTKIVCLRSLLYYVMYFIPVLCVKQKTVEF